MLPILQSGWKNVLGTRKKFKDILSNFTCNLFCNSFTLNFNLKLGKFVNKTSSQVSCKFRVRFFSVHHYRLPGSDSQRNDPNLEKKKRNSMEMSRVCLCMFLREIVRWQDFPSPLAIWSSCFRSFFFTSFCWRWRFFRCIVFRFLFYVDHSEGILRFFALLWTWRRVLCLSCCVLFLNATSRSFGMLLFCFMEKIKIETVGSVLKKFISLVCKQFKYI